MLGVIMGGKRTDREHPGDDLGTVEAEVHGVLPQATGRQRWPRSQKKQRRILPWRLQREPGPADSLISDLCFQNMTGYVSVRCKAPSLWNLAAPVPALKGHTVCGQPRFLSRYVCPSGPRDKFLFSSPISCSPSFVAQATGRTLPGFSATGQMVEASRTTHVVSVLMLLPH